MRSSSPVTDQRDAAAIRTSATPPSSPGIGSSSTCERFCSLNTNPKTRKRERAVLARPWATGANAAAAAPARRRPRCRPALRVQPCCSWPSAPAHRRGHAAVAAAAQAVRRVTRAQAGLPPPLRGRRAATAGASLRVALGVADQVVPVGGALDDHHALARAHQVRVRVAEALHQRRHRAAARLGHAVGQLRARARARAGGRAGRSRQVSRVSPWQTLTKP